MRVGEGWGLKRFEKLLRMGLRWYINFPKGPQTLIQTRLNAFRRHKSDLIYILYEKLILLRPLSAKTFVQLLPRSGSEGALSPSIPFIRSEILVWERYLSAYHFLRILNKSQSDILKSVFMYKKTY